MAQQNAHASLSRKESIADIVDDLKLLKVSTNENDTVSSMRGTRESKIQELKKTNGTINEGYIRVLDDLNQTRERRHILQEYYKKVKNVLDETEVICQKEKDDFLAGAEECITDLESYKRFVVLIAGETSAGKSSMINLLLNEQVLPTNTMTNTFTICEISYGLRKEAVVHFAKQEMKPLKLVENKFDTIKQYIEKPRNDEEWCEKIEIKIPNALLKDGIVIVDSPGIGDSEDVSNIVLEYLPQAFAFIYVINSPNAGGLQEDRLLRIVKKWIKLYRGEKHKPITAQSALFVCNKWDEVEKNAKSDRSDEKDVLRHVISNLKKKISDLDEESQVIKMSVNRATLVQQKFNVMSDDLNSLIDGIQHLLPLWIEQETEKFYRWISGHLTNLTDQVKGKMRNAKRNREERLQARKEVDKKLKSFKQVSIRNYEEALSNHVKQISERVKSYLQSDDVRLAFCKWTKKDLPNVDDDQRGSEVELKKIYKKCIEQRLEAFLEKLENKEKLFSKAHAELQKLFHRVFFDFEKDTRNIDQVLVGESMDEVKPNEKLCPPLDKRATKFLVSTSANFMPVFFTIGMVAGVITAPTLEPDLADGKGLKHLDTINACQVLTELSTKFLQAFIAHKVTNHVEQEFTDENSRISSTKTCHQELIDKYEKRCKELTKSEDEATANQTVETLHGLSEKLKDMNKNLMFDAIQQGIQVMHPPCQIDKRRLQWTDEEKLGKGNYGTVYKGKFRPPGRKKKNVAVKHLNDAPEPSNVASFLGEAAMLMQLKHRHIVRFYGVTMDVENHKLKSLALVCKLCVASLKDHIFDNEEFIPWKTASAAAVTCQWSEQILDALEFIHSKDVVHRDLKVDNVLISRHNRIKIADMGLATFKDSITGTVCGTRPYLAPEVKQGEVYDSKVDIYSFGIMMWEMWFGKRAATSQSSKSANEVDQQIEKLRAEGSFNPPPAKWVQLMTSCWHSDPCSRPTATESKKDFIEDLKRGFEQDI